MRSFVTPSLLVLACASLSGCLYARGMKAYESPRLQVGNISPALLHEALHAAISGAGWELVGTDPSVGMLEAMTPVEDVAGVLTRERWHFTVDAQGIAVRMRLEAKWEPDEEWTSTDHVCLEYAYLRENVFLDAVSQALVELDETPADPWMRLTASVD